MRGPVIRTVAVFTVAFVSVGYAAPVFEFFKPDTPQRPFAVMVHRGRMDLAPENTAPAIEACIAHGYEWLEIDVRLTEDGHHVVFHDAHVDEKTNGSGAVSELTLSEIKSLDAGSAFSKEFAGVKILTFAELLHLTKGKINVYVDCKDVNPDRLVSEILSANMANQVVVFDDLDVLTRVRQLSGNRIPIMPKWHPEFGIDDWVHRVKPAAVEINAEEVTPEVCRRFHALGVVVQAKVLDANDRPEVWRRMLTAGVQWFQTDRPDELIAECVAVPTSSVEPERTRR